jgi:predicted AlkP superfamily pyrophosphatase or phosphodiesterase
MMTQAPLFKCSHYGQRRQGDPALNEVDSEMGGTLYWKEKNITMTKPSPKRKVMVFGHDGLSLKVLLPLVEKSELPNFARYLQNGAHGILQSMTNMTTGPTWTSFATGCQPKQHGILHDFHHHLNTYQ